MSLRPQYPPELVRFGGASLKLRRAERHIDDLDHQISDYLGSNPYRVVEDTHSEAGQYILRVKVTAWPPNELALLVGDAVTNLRAALDHLIYDLTAAHSGRVLRGTAFPILMKSDHWAEVGRSGRPSTRSGCHLTRGIHPEAKRIIYEVQPFQAGEEQAASNPLAMLNKLCNIDKHRALTFCGATMGQVVLYSALGPQDRWVTGPGPFIDGQQLATLRLKPGEKPRFKLEGSFHVAFDHRTPYQGTIVVPALRTMDEAVVQLMAMLIRFAA